MKTHPCSIKIIALTYCIMTLLAIWDIFFSIRAPTSPDMLQALFVGSLTLIPAILGMLLLKGKRWVRWLFVLVVFLIIILALITSLGSAFSTVNHETSGARYYWIAVLISIISTIRVFSYFSKK